MDKNKSQILLYQTQDGKTQIEVTLENETVWLTQDQMVQLFQSSKSNISEHVNNIFKEGELEQSSVVRKSRTTAKDGKSYEYTYYNLDIIISVGYRIGSYRGTQFRIWATQTLREFIVKGFVLDDERLEGTKRGYFDELQERVRSIRTSEKNFWNKVTDIFSTSIDYDSHADIAILFFKQIQNMFHYAIHGHTAPELIAERVDAKKANMGLTSFKGDHVTKADAIIAKNYLTESELKRLNLLVDQYLAYAELQSIEKRAMYMRDWISRTQQFFIFNEKPILDNAGHVSRALADAKATKEYEKYDKARREYLREVRKLSPAQDISDDREVREVKYDYTPFDKTLKGILEVPKPPKENK